jgi:hypothetical protein
VAGDSVVRVDPASTRMVPVRLRVELDKVPAGSHRIEFEVRTLDEQGLAVSERSMFLVR